MASNQGPDNPAPESDQAQKLYDDPVTGEKISKTELKRRAKQREKEKAKEEKAKTQPTTQAKKPGNPEDELNPNVGNGQCAHLVLY